MIMAMNYIPKLTHKETSRSIRHAIQWAEWWFSKTPVKPTAFTVIVKHLGNQYRPKGQWLRSKCLNEVDSHYNMLTGKVKKYSLNSEGIRELQQLLKHNGLDPDQVALSLSQEQELESGQFNYNLKSDRQFHSLQYIPTRIRKPMFASHGYRHEYDIKCAVYTLITQHARLLGYQQPTPCLDEYVANTTRGRQELAQRCNITESHAKRVFTAICQGSYLRAQWDCELFQQLGRNHTALQLIQQDPFIRNIRLELRDLWSFLKQDMGISKRITARDKAGLYRSLEKQIMREVIKILKRTKNNHFVEHDGWFCKEAVDISEMVSSVRRKTGYNIELDWSINEYISE